MSENLVEDSKETPQLDSNNTFNTITTSPQITSFNSPSTKKSNILDDLNTISKIKLDWNFSSFSKAKYHQKSSRIGSHRSTHMEEKCSCCGQVPLTPFKFTKNPCRITEFGNTIPLYFYFFRLIFGYIIILMISFSIPTYKISKIYCEFLEINNEKCGYLDMLIASEPDFLKQNQYEIGEIYLDNYTIFQICNVVMIIYAVFVKIVHKKKIEKLKEEEKIDASCYTVMLGNVKKKHKEEKIRDYIYGVARLAGLHDAKIAKINKATFQGNIRYFEKEAKQLELEIDRLKNSQFYLEKKKIKPFLKFFKKKEKNLKTLNKRIKKYKKMYKKSKSSFNRNCLVFVTFTTSDQKAIVLEESKAQRHCFLRLLDPSYEYKIMDVPSPENIQWTKIGYSTSRRYLYTVSTFLLINLIVMPLFAYGIIFMKVIYENLTSKKDVKNAIKFFFFIIGPVIVIKYAGFFGKILDYYSKGEKFLTRNRYLVSKVKRVVLSRLICFAILVVAKGPGEYEKVSFFGNAKDRTAKFLMLQAFLEPILSYFDFGELKKYFLRKKLTENLSIEKRRKKTKGKVKYTEYHFMEQKDLNHFFEYSDCEIDQKYANISSALFIALICSVVIPVSPVIALMYFTLQYNIDKFMFFRRFRKPVKDTALLSQNVSDFCLIFPKLFICFRFLLIAVYADGRNLPPLNIIFDLVLFILIVIPISFISRKIEEIEKKRGNRKRAPLQDQSLSVGLKNSLDSSLGGSQNLNGLAKKKNCGNFGFFDVDFFLEDDYDRENPLTMVRSKKLWGERKKRKTEILRTGNTFFCNLEKAIEENGGSILKFEKLESGEFHQKVD